MTRCVRVLGALSIATALTAGSTSLSASQQVPKLGGKPAQASVSPAGIVPPADYVLGAGDMLSVKFIADDKDVRDMGADVVVRPDGKISLSLLNDIEVIGLTPEEARGRITETAKRFVEDPTVSVIVKEIHSRQVFISGLGVERPNAYPLGGPMTVSQLIIMAGGVKEYAKKDRIQIHRMENGRETRFPFNYDDFLKGKNAQQDIYLKPGDQVQVP